MYKKLIFSTLLLNILCVSNVILGMKEKTLSVKVDTYAIGYVDNNMSFPKQQWVNAQDNSDIEKKQFKSHNVQQHSVLRINKTENKLTIHNAKVSFTFDLLKATPGVKKVILNSLSRANKVGQDTLNSLPQTNNLPKEINLSIATLDSNYDGGSNLGKPDNIIFHITNVIDETDTKITQTEKTSWFSLETLKNLKNKFTIQNCFKVGVPIIALAAGAVVFLYKYLLLKKA